MNKKQTLEREIFELIGDAYAGNSVISVRSEERRVGKECISRW